MEGSVEFEPPSSLAFHQRAMQGKVGFNARADEVELIPWLKRLMGWTPLYPGPYLLPSVAIGDRVAIFCPHNRQPVFLQLSEEKHS